MNRALATVGVVLVLGTVAVASEKRAAPPPAPGEPRLEGAQDTNAQLLQEVRQLREAIEMMVSTGARVQIVFGRLQLQEQRTATAARRLDDLRDTRARVTREAAEGAARFQELEEHVHEARGGPEERSIEAMLQQMKRVSAMQETERQRILTEESVAAGVLATEQARWAELNQQLEDLERVLAKRP